MRVICEALMPMPVSRTKNSHGPSSWTRRTPTTTLPRESPAARRCRSNSPRTSRKGSRHSTIPTATTTTSASASAQRMARTPYFVGAGCGAGSTGCNASGTSCRSIGLASAIIASTEPVVIGW